MKRARTRRTIFNLRREAAIYSTAAGALARYKTNELASEWSRLEKLPPDQFDVEVGAPISHAPSAASTKSAQLEFADL
jgi:hypothetical protein